MTSDSRQGESVIVGWGTLAPAAFLLAGAVFYGVLVGGGLLRFTATPLLLGLIVIAAGLVGTRRRLVASGLVLAGWGAAVVLVEQGVVPSNRTTPAYMLGIGVGLVVALALAPRPDREEWLITASITAFTSPLSFYLVDDVRSLGHWAVWSILLVGWAAWDVFFAWRTGNIDGADVTRL